MWKLMIQVLPYLKRIFAKVMILPVPVAKVGDVPRGLLWAHFLVMFNQGGTTGRADSFGAKLLTAVGLDNNMQATLWRETGQIPTLKANLAEVGKDPYAQGFLDAA